ncbi:MAG: cupin domain-containing protein [Candidatus Geothermincolales bacterium]
MKVINHADIEAVNPGGESRGVSLKWLIARGEGAPRFFMRLFEIEPGGHTPLHSHPWEHEVFVLSGRGEVKGSEKTFDLRPGDAAYIEEGEVHQFRNVGDTPFVFICVVPSYAEG